MDNQEYIKVSKEIRNYKIARMNIILAIALTLVNIFVYMLSETYFLFSVYTSVFFVAVGKESKKLAVQQGNDSYGAAILGVCIAIAIIVLVVYLVFWLLSKKHRWAMIVLLVLFSVDCLMVLLNFSAYSIPDIVIHAFVIYYFILGVKAASNLQKHFPQGVALTVGQLDEAYRIENGIDPRTGMPVLGPDGQPIAPQGGSGAPVGYAQPQVPAQPVGYDPMTGAPVYENAAAAAPSEASAKPDSPVIRTEDSKRVPALETVYKGMKVCVKMSPFSCNSRIVVDGKVYAEQKVKLLSVSSYSAVVNGTEFVFEYRPNGSGGEYILYADGNIIAHRF